MPRGEISADMLYVEAVDSARRRPPAERLLDGVRLFDRACEIMLAGIRHDHPGVDADRAMEMLRARLRLARDLEK